MQSATLPLIAAIHLLVCGHIHTRVRMHLATRRGLAESEKDYRESMVVLARRLENTLAWSAGVLACVAALVG